MEHNHQEIVLLASGILILVALLSVILYLGHRKRTQEQRRDSQESQRSYSSFQHAQGRECLFKTVFSDHPDHDSPLIGHCGRGTSFIATVRKRTESVAGAVQHELRDLGRSLRVSDGSSRAGEVRPLLGGDADARMLRESSTTNGDGGEYCSDTGMDDGYQGAARRRNSSVAKHGGSKKRNSRFIEHLDQENGGW